MVIISPSLPVQSSRQVRREKLDSFSILSLKHCKSSPSSTCYDPCGGALCNPQTQITSQLCSANYEPKRPGPIFLPQCSPGYNTVNKTHKNTRPIFAYINKLRRQTNFCVDFLSQFFCLFHFVWLLDLKVSCGFGRQENDRSDSFSTM